MVRHALQLIWNRRGANALIVVEIGLAFVAAFAVLALAAHYWTRYQRPLGFEYEDVWRVRLQTASSALQLNDGWTVENAQTVRNVLQAVRGLPGVEAAHVMRVTPFTGGQSRGPYRFEEGKIVGVSQNALTSGALQALGVTLVDGRWFDETDEGQSYRAAVVNRAYLTDVLGRSVSPFDKNINQLVEHPTARSLEGVPQFFLREVRIVGVVANLRASDFADETPLVVTQYELEHAVENAVEHPNSLFVKVAPGTSADLERQIIDTVKKTAPEWGAIVTRWEQLRERSHSQVLTPILVAATVAAFVLVMVTLGLIGVVGLDVARRTQEIGLRRAIGASAGSVRRQIVLELLITGLFGIFCGTIIAIQFPLLQLVEQIDGPATALGIALAAGMTILLVMLSALYPSWLASRREPADALRYE